MKPKTKKYLRVAIVAVVVILIVLQFFQTNTNNGESASPNDLTHAVNVPRPVLNILQQSCFDCHSNHTNYPWYAYIQPVGWWLSDHIKDGKEELNFSEFNTYPEKRKNKKLEKIADEVEEGEMPLNSYLIIHTDSKLSEAEKNELVSWAKSTKSL